MKKARPISSVRICEPISTAHALASTAPAINPASGPRHRRHSIAETMTRMKPVIAGHSRAVHSSAPKTRKTSAENQYWSGGFSKYLRPLRRGVT
jgi:hypothetical protein